MTLASGAHVRKAWRQGSDKQSARGLTARHMGILASWRWRNEPWSAVRIELWTSSRWRRADLSVFVPVLP